MDEDTAELAEDLSFVRLVTSLELKDCKLMSSVTEFHLSPKLFGYSAPSTRLFFTICRIEALLELHSRTFILAFDSISRASVKYRFAYVSVSHPVTTLSTKMLVSMSLAVKFLNCLRCF